MDLLVPVGFKFLPTDETLVDFYLRTRVRGQPIPHDLIKDFDVYKLDPQTISETVLGGRSEGYFFSPRERKHKNGNVVNRTAGIGLWKTTSVEKAVTRKSDGCTVGKKHVLKFFIGTPSRKEGTDWIMHEYEIHNPHSSDKFQDVVLCKIYKRNVKEIPNHIDFGHGLAEGNPFQQLISSLGMEVEAAPPSDPPTWTVEEEEAMVEAFSAVLSDPE